MLIKRARGTRVLYSHNITWLSFSQWGPGVESNGLRPWAFLLGGFRTSLL